MPFNHKQIIIEPTPVIETTRTLVGVIIVSENLYNIVCYVEDIVGMDHYPEYSLSNLYLRLRKL